MSTDDQRESLPQSIRHKQILDVAEENPDASIEELASLVPSATPELVERVLDEHGDPAVEDDIPSDSEDSPQSTNESTEQRDDPDTETATTDTTAETADHDEQATMSEEGMAAETESDGYPSVDGLSDKHRELVKAVAAQPEATQKELSNQLGVARQTVGRWANDIEGFEWSERESFVEAVFDEPPSPDLTMDGGSTSETTSTNASQIGSAESSSTGADEDTTDAIADIKTELKHLNERVTTLEESRGEKASKPESVLEDPELVHKIVYSCIDSDTLTESEKLHILKELLA